MCCLPGPALLILLVTASFAMPLKFVPASHDNSWPTPTHPRHLGDADALQQAAAYLNSRRLQSGDPLYNLDFFRPADGADRREGGSSLLTDDTDMEQLTKLLDLITSLEGELIGREQDRFQVADETRLEDDDLSALFREEADDGARERPRREIKSGSRRHRTLCHGCPLTGRKKVESSEDADEFSEETLSSRDKKGDINDSSKSLRVRREAGNEQKSKEYLLSQLDNKLVEVEGALLPWDGKRAADFHSWGGKRAGHVFNVEPGASLSDSSGSGKRAPDFNSWGGKRAPAFNSWGGKRAPDFNSWGGKRAPAFNSWGGKRAPAFNSWGGKRAPAFNSWGGKRAPSFHSWGGKRATGFNSWGGKRVVSVGAWDGKRAPAFNSWGGKRSADTSTALSSGESEHSDVAEYNVSEPITIKVEKRSVKSDDQEGQRIVRNSAVDFYPWGGKRSNLI